MTEERKPDRFLRRRWYSYSSTTILWLRKRWLKSTCHGYPIFFILLCVCISPIVLAMHADSRCRWQRGLGAFNIGTRKPSSSVPVAFPMEITKVTERAEFLAETALQMKGGPRLLERQRIKYRNWFT